jgi:excisionase family DNA binding protein
MVTGQKGVPANQLLTVPEVARQCGICVRSVWTLIKSGKLRSLKIGKSVRVRPTDMEAFLEGCAQ